MKRGDGDRKTLTFNCSSFSSKVVFKVAISSFRIASRLSLSCVKGKKSSPSVPLAYS